MDSRYTVRLDISPDVFRCLYSGQASSVLATDSEGRKLRFPASSLRKFVTREGIHGTYVLEIDAHNRLIGIHCTRR